MASNTALGESGGRKIAGGEEEREMEAEGLCFLQAGRQGQASADGGKGSKQRQRSERHKVQRQRPSQGSPRPG